MKKLLLTLLAAMCAAAGATGADRAPEIISVNTDRVSLILCVERDGRVHMRLSLIHISEPTRQYS